MGAQMRIYRQRIKSVNSIKKITNAMELIAAARVIKARQRAVEAMPYTNALTRAVSAVASHTNEDHPLTTAKTTAHRAGVVIITSDRGLAGSYAASALKEAAELSSAVKMRLRTYFGSSRSSTWSALGSNSYCGTS